MRKLKRWYRLQQTDLELIENAQLRSLLADTIVRENR
jgi:hypothetical protein